MNADNPVFAIAALALFLGCSWAMLRLSDMELPKGRLTSIDGLRGFLAASVFIHHSLIWRGYLLSGVWQAPDSNFYNQLGQSSVGLFFMITGFLFTRRLLEGNVDWARLYAGRFARLTPLYLVALALMLTLVAWRSGFTLRQPAALVLGQSLRWLTFGCLTPPINGLEDTGLITAYVTWTLPWEWKFYLLLPFIAFALGRSHNRPVVWLAGLVVVLLLIFAPTPRLFLGGVLAAFLVRDARWLAFAPTRRAALAAIACLLAALLLFHSAFRLPPLIFLTAFFAIVAGGNTLFGVLAWRPSRLLGEISFSVYLLHGLLLFALFRLILPAPQALSDTQHWLVAGGAIPLLVVVCLTTFRWVESPGVRRTKALQEWVMKSFPFLRAGA